MSLMFGWICTGLLEFTDPQYGAYFRRLVRCLTVPLFKGPPDMTGKMDDEAFEELVRT
jgi:hypothetical protein